jgi:bacteriocin-like protein
MDIDVSGLSLGKDELKESTMTKLTKENRELSPTQPNSQPDKGAPGFVKTELSEEELSQVSGGKSSSCLALACATGKHFATAKITL